jgi:hypothetical protein
VAVTNLQLLLSIGIPSFLVVLSWISNNARFTALEARITSLESRILGLENRMTALESHLNEAIMSQHRDSLEIMRNMASLHERVALVEARQAA